MNKTLELTLTPEEAFDEQQFNSSLYRKLKLSDSEWYVKPLKRSIDARRHVVVRLQVELIPRPFEPQLPEFHYLNVVNEKEVIVVGGPAGLFHRVEIDRAWVRPIVLERGKDVQARRRTLRRSIRTASLIQNPIIALAKVVPVLILTESYTPVPKRGNVQRILEIMVANGATSEILFDTHPHIGTNKLPRLVAALREKIIACGGVVRFDAKVTDFILEGSRIRGVTLSDGEILRSDAVILATGHSARDIFELLDRRKILIEPKAFALGLRIEHPQSLIDQIQYHCASDRGPYLPASSYALVHQAKVNGRERGVFFCMCPGGFIVPAATAPGEVVVNGMSPSRRDSRYANSGIVVTVEPGDFKAYERFGALAGVHFQSDIEKRACEVAGGTQAAPAQRMIDFTRRKLSVDLPSTSYQPGVVAAELSSVLPGFINESLRQGLVVFGEKMKGYMTNDAQVVGVESRTSSPIRIPRSDETLEHPQVKGLFPCAEGAGYAGGIVSAAMDGERCAEAVALLIKEINHPKYEKYIRITRSGKRGRFLQLSAGTNKDFISGLSVSNSGLDFEEANLVDADNLITKVNEVAMSKTISIEIKGITNYQVQDGQVYPGMDLVVTDKDGTVVLEGRDILADEEGYDAEKASVLSGTVTAGEPMTSGQTYLARMKVWDKLKPENQINAEVEIVVMP